MDINSNQYFLQKQYELSETLGLLQNQLSAVKMKVDGMNSKIEPLENSLQAIAKEHTELKRLIEIENKTIEEYALKLANTQWSCTKSQLTVATEKAAMGVYFKIMEQHKNNSPITNSTALRVPYEELLNNDNTKEKRAKQVTSAQILELEDNAAHYNITRLESQKKLSSAKEQNSILHKRNAATLLRLRKSLQESENIRKSLIDRRSVVMMKLPKN